MLKCSSERWVCAPHNLSAGTSTTPRLSVSLRISVMVSLASWSLGLGWPSGHVCSGRAERLEEIGRALFVAAGTEAEEAALVMRHIVGANLVGHDSHGVIQIPTYIERIKAGHIVPGAPWEIVRESA